MAKLDRLLSGFRSFRARYYDHRPEQFEAQKAGQSPDVLVIGCSDSRVDPAIVLQAEPGELFVVRNVANVVPPYQPDGNHHGTSAALEYAVRDLGVGTILVLGHSGCGGIRGLVRQPEGTPPPREFLGPWMSIVRAACAYRPLADSPAGNPEDLRHVEHAALRISLANLGTYPWIRERIERKELGAYAWWFEMDTGKLWSVRTDTESVSRLI